MSKSKACDYCATMGPLSFYTQTTYAMVFVHLFWCAYFGVQNGWYSVGISQSFLIFRKEILVFGGDLEIDENLSLS